MSVPEVVCRMNVAPTHAAKAEYALALLAAAWGARVRTTSDAATVHHMAYGSGGAGNGENRTVLRIPFDPAAYASQASFRLRWRAGYALWEPEDTAAPADWIGAIYRLVALLDEQGVPEERRDDRGAFATAALPPARAEAAHLPLVEHLAAYLWQQLCARWPGLAGQALPRWPAGKAYAVCLTHDTDAVSLSTPRELLAHLGKGLLRRGHAQFRMFRDGLKYVGKGADNPVFGFPTWRWQEDEWSVRSAFYLYPGVLRVRRDLRDCRSSALQRGMDRGLLRAMAGEGWEFGLHPCVRARESIDELIRGKARVEEALECPVWGVRHHYWALDWRRPHRTFRLHVNAGFRYDTSLAFLDRPGFRTGSSLPFRPFDPVWDRPLDLYELTPCLMDRFVLDPAGQGAAAGVDAGRRAIAAARERGGVAVLDWHTETACDTYCYTNFFTVLRRILAPYVEDSSA